MTPVRIRVGAAEVEELTGVVRELQEWQDDAAPVQLHPGDLGWFWRRGAQATAEATRTWRRDGQLLAVGLLDGPDVLRLTIAPHAAGQEDLAHQVLQDAADPQQGVLPAGKASIETPNGTLVQEVLTQAGWGLGQPWTPLRRDLRDPVGAPEVRIEVVTPERAEAYAAVVRSSFGTARFTEQSWRAMAAGAAYDDARSLLVYDGDAAVAAVTVWSAGPGRPGLLEPMGVHADHRGRGHGRAICLAAAAQLRQLGCSSAVVCTPSPLAAAIATYRSAGFAPLPERLDRTRDA